jgi:hypothetical protein
MKQEPPLAMDGMLQSFFQAVRTQRIWAIVNRRTDEFQGPHLAVVSAAQEDVQAVSIARGWGAGAGCWMRLGEHAEGNRIHSNEITLAKRDHSQRT